MSLRALTACLLYWTLATPALAAVSAEEAAQLGETLTPLGAEKSADDNHGIPQWTGGYQWPSTPPESQRRHPENYPGLGDQKPLFSVNKSNVDEYREFLTPGHQKLFDSYGDTYRMDVYPSQRSVFAPDYVYEATKKNATTASMEHYGESMNAAAVGIPFPIPKQAQEIIWNHKTRYRGQSISRYNVQLAVHTNGSFVAHKLREDILFSFNLPDARADSLDGVLAYFLQATLAPPRAAGQVLLVHETMNQLEDTRRAWLYNPGQRRVRRAPNVAYDNPGSGSDGLRTNDQLDVFNGATDRYRWRLKGKKVMLVPYNAYKLLDNRVSYDDIIEKQHPNQDYMRYEFHRVWVVESTLRENTNHIYARRTFYVDEDSWTILMVDIYDAREQLWRYQEYHQVMIPWTESVGPAGHMIFDFNSRRYLAMEISNEEPLFEVNDFAVDHFRSSNVRKVASRLRR